MQTDKQRDSQIDRQTNRHVGGQTDRYADRQTQYNIVPIAIVSPPGVLGERGEQSPSNLREPKSPNDE